MTNKVLPRQMRKLDRLFGEIKIVPVEMIFLTLYKGQTLPPSRRLTSMRVGWPLTRYRRATGHQVVPGPEEYTYTRIGG